MSPEPRVYLFLSRIRTLQRSTSYHLYRHRDARSGPQKPTAYKYLTMFFRPLTGGRRPGGHCCCLGSLGSLGTHGAWLISIHLSGPALLRASPHHVYLVCVTRCATWRGLKIKRTAVIYNTHSDTNLVDVHSYHYDLNVVFYLCRRINTYKFYNLYGK